MQDPSGLHSCGRCIFIFSQLIGVYHVVSPSWLMSISLCIPKPSLDMMFTFSCGWFSNSGGVQLSVASNINGRISFCVMLKSGSTSETLIVSSVANFLDIILHMKQKMLMEAQLHRYVHQKTLRLRYSVCMGGRLQVLAFRLQLFH